MIKPTVGMMVRQLVDEALEIDLLIPKGATGTITAIETDKGGNVDGVVVRFDQPIKNLENNQMFWTRDHFHPTPFLEAFWKEMELVKKVKLRFYAVKLDGTDVFFFRQDRRHRHLPPHASKVGIPMGRYCTRSSVDHAA
jgi:hypothetical protein